eukprot:COSAG04_NODE_135_length_23774_cov_40.993918_13_plen_67_part_00
MEAVTDVALGTCILRCVKAHTAYAGGSEQLLALRTGELVAVVEEKPETGWCAALLLCFRRSLCREC